MERDGPLTGAVSRNSSGTAPRFVPVAGRGYHDGMRAIATTLLLVALLPAALPAQRAACTGTLAGLDDRPIAGAEVTFVQEESQTLGAEPDRVAAVTDADGAFTAELLHGSPYVVWAIGPAGDGGERWLTGVTMDAAAGKAIELLADRRAAPAEVELTGVSAWSAHLPTALRVLVDGRYPLAADHPLAGDCTLPLGPWPGHEVLLALVDDKRQPIARSDRVWERDARVAFPAPRELRVEVVDVDDRPVAGARIAVGELPWALASSSCDPLPGWQWQSFRQSERTDAHGRATVRVPAVYDLRLVASDPGHAPSVSGFVSARAFADFERHRDDEAPLRFVLRPTEPARLRLAGFDAGPPPRVLFWPFFRIGRSGFDYLHVPARIEDSVAGGLLPAVSPGARFFVRLPPTAAAAPPRICSAADVSPERRTELDARRLVPRTVRIVDRGGAPVPFAHVAVASLPAEGCVLHDRCCADARGRVHLLLGRTEWRILATDGARFGAVRIDAADAGADADAGPGVRLVLAPRPVAHVRVLDVRGAPIAGARVEDVSSIASYRKGELWRGECARAAILSARSDREGLLRLPVGPRGFGHVIVRHGDRRSGPMSVDSTVGVTIAELR